MGHLAQTMTDPLLASVNGAIPDWTPRWAVHGTPQLAYFDTSTTNNIGPNVLYVEGKVATGIGLLLAWDRLDLQVHQSADTDMLVLFQYIEGPDVDDNFIMGARASGAGGSENGYALRDAQSGTEWELSEWSAGVETIIDTWTGPTLVINTWYWAQLRVEGTSIKGRMWAYGDQNPGTWNLEATDGTHTAVGWTGFGAGFSNDIEVDFVAVGTDGAPAQLPKVLPAGATEVTATPARVQLSASSHLVFVGEPNKSLGWAITVGDGSLDVASNQTDSLGRAYNTYFPGTEGVKTIEVTYGT